jgi:hypothetical protein
MKRYNGSLSLKTFYLALHNSLCPLCEHILFFLAFFPMGIANDIVLSKFDEGPDTSPNQILG